MTLTYTSRLRLAVPDFLTEPWHGEFAQAMESIDRMVYDALLMQGASLWLNSHAYIVGDVVISPDSGALYTCATPHTSSASPTTFTAELAAHPTYWTTTGPVLATQAEAEAGTDNSKFMSPLRTKQAIAAQSAQVQTFTPRAGQLTRLSASQLAFKPYNGDKIKINGVLYDIPSGGIAGLGNTGVRVDAVAGQNLAANSVYHVYASNVGGIVTGNFSPSAQHKPSQTAGNVGVEVSCSADFVTEFQTDTLIGIIRTNASAQFEDNDVNRYVRSWFNAPPKRLEAFINVDAGFSSASLAEIAAAFRVNWVQFSDDVVALRFMASCQTTVPHDVTMTIVVNGATQNVQYYQNMTTAGARYVFAPQVSIAMGTNNANQATVYAIAASGITVKASVGNGNQATFAGMISGRG